ncbi:peptide chain release factor N(5)-glutamine methyltransferase [Wocania ichthyoenteri]|uniref:peptide chain release factor N(5)-glutamine methyltransferase n=1 Tax=Wocania ichthyoenteri TaxID=1230531 RepID=UPI00053D0428|nr:peptide chain release factor N(5)-glutamine methyltransferase [Wocania ichthyoenteri]
MKLKDIQKTFHLELDAIYGKEEVDSFFFMLIDSFYKISRLKLAIEPNFEIENKEAILNALKVLKKEEPIQYIIGETEFYGLPFKVDKDVLIPRPETEELVEWVINEFKNEVQICHTERSRSTEINILDIGTGSGCIAISLAKSLPNAKVYALDVSKKALQIAKQNAELNNVKIECIEADILTCCDAELVSASHKFDIIVSNPPYVREQEKRQIKSNVLNNEPHLALFVKDENPLLFYNAISDFATHKLNDKGRLFFEINEYLGNDMIRLLKEKQFKNIELKQDIFKKDRMIKGGKI